MTLSKPGSKHHIASHEQESNNVQASANICEKHLLIRPDNDERHKILTQLQLLDYFFLFPNQEQQHTSKDQDKTISASNIWKQIYLIIQFEQEKIDSILKEKEHLLLGSLCMFAFRNNAIGCIFECTFSTKSTMLLEHILKIHQTEMHIINWPLTSEEDSMIKTVGWVMTKERKWCCSSRDVFLLDY